jgi:hypothetical protein
MAQFTDPLSNVRIAAPCRADWERMRGNERVRFCGECSMNVYNLSNMTRKDAEALILSAEGRLCVRYYNRADGSILTQNCPVGLQKLRRRVSGVSRAVVSSVLSFFAGMAVLAGLETVHSTFDAATEADLNLIAPVPLTIIESKEESTPEPVSIMGDIARERPGYWVEGQMAITETQVSPAELRSARE